MADLDALRADLGRGSSVAGDGEFTIDSQRARDKLRDFQLAEPRVYVVLLVQVATLVGATKISFTLDSNDLIAEFDGRPFTYNEAEDLYAQIFIDARTAEQRARQRLALALNAAISLRPRSVQLTSSGPDGGVRLDLRPGQPDHLSRFDATASARPTTRIHVKERRRLGRISDYLTLALEEEQHLRRLCAAARIRVDIDGKRLFNAWENHRLEHAVELREPGVRGVAGLTPATVTYRADPVVAVVDLHLHGVHVARRELPLDLPARLSVMLDCDDLRDDLSLTNIVEDDAYDAAMAAAARALDRCVVQLCHRYRDHQDRAILQIIERYLERTWPAHGRDREAWRSYAQLPRWPALDGRLRTTAELDAQPAVDTTTLKPGRSLPDYRHVIVLERGDLDLSLVLRGRLRDVTADLERAELAERNRQSWRSRPREPRLPDRSAAASVSVDAHGIRGELALRPSAAGRNLLTVVAEGCTLCNLMPQLPLDGIDAALAGDFRPNATYDGVVPNPALASAAVLLLRHLDQIVQRIAESYADPQWQRHLPRSALHRYIYHLSRGDALVNLLRSLGFHGPDAAHLEGVVHLPPPVLDLHPNSRQPLVHVPLFRATQGPRVSLHELALRRAAGERIPVIADSERLPADFDERCLCVDAAERALLTQVFGDALEGRDQALARAHQRAELRRRPVHSGELADTIFSGELRDGALRGQIGVTAAGLRLHSAFAVTVLVDRRRVASYQLQTALPGLTAVIHTDDLDRAATSELQLLPDRPLARALAAGAAAIVDAVLRDPRDTTILRPLLTGALAAIYGAPEARRIDEVTRLGAPDLADHALREHMHRDERDAAVDAFNAALRLALVEHLTALRAAPIFPTVQGPPRSLDQLLENAAHIAALPAPLRGAFGSPHQISCADLSAGADPNLPQEPAVLALRSASIPHLTALFELNHLDADHLRAWRGHNVSRQRPPPIAAAYACQLASPVAVGEIGLPSDLERADPVIYVHRGGWLIGQVRADSPLPLIGLVEGPELDLDPQGDGLSQLARRRLDELVRHATAQIIHELIRAYERAPAPDRRLRWLLSALIHLLDPQRDSDPSEDEARERLADLPLFPVLGGGQRCFRELHALLELDGFLHCAPLGADLPATYPVLLIDPELAGLYAQLFPDLRLFPALLTGAARDPLPQPDHSALHALAFTAEGLRGQLWLSAAPHFWLEIHLGSGAHLDRTLALPTLVPALFAGERDAADPDAPLSQSQADALARAALDLHVQALHRYVDAFQRERAEASARPLAQRLQARLGGRDPAEFRRYFALLFDHLSHLIACGVPLDHEHMTFYRALDHAPIIELPGGRVIDPHSDRQLDGAPHPAGAAPVDAPAPATTPPAGPPPPPARPPAEPAPPPDDPAPAPAIEPPEGPSPEDLLLQSVRDELRLLTPDPQDHLLFETIQLADADAELVELRGDAVLLARAHPVVQRALALREDAALCASILTSAVFSALNARYARITDDHEAAFHQRHAAHLLSA